MSKLSRYLSRAAMVFSALGLVAMTAIIGWQVFARYALGNAPAWTEQAALFLMLWFIVFAAAVGVREGFHIRISLLQDTASGSHRYLLRQGSNLVVLAFGALMAWDAYRLVNETWQHVIPTLGLPRGLAYVPLVGGGVLVVFFAIEQLLAEATGKTVEAQWS